jgi:pimeloyl-ACP methyl ester carboxylesterase
MATRRVRIIVLAAVVAAVVLAVVPIAAILLRPLAVFETMERWRLGWIGMERRVAQGPKGPITYWRGGTGPPVFLLHGANDQAGTWVYVLPMLLSGHRVVAADLPGHGASAPADGPLSVRDLVEGVEALVAAEAPGGRVTLVGNSLGGWLALVYADRHPGRVERVVLVNGAAIRGDGSEARVNLLPKSRAEARAALQATMSPASRPVPGFVLDDLVRRAPASPLARLVAGPPGDEFLVDARLGGIRVPVTLIWGEDDQVLPVAYARRVAAALSAAELVTLPQCGHVPQRECPDRLGPALERALAPGR